MEVSLSQFTNKTEYILFCTMTEQRVLSLSENSCVQNAYKETNPLLCKGITKTMMLLKLKIKSIKHLPFFKNDDSDMMNEDDKHQLERSLYEYRYIK